MTYNLVGVGSGVFNLSLATLIKETGLSSLFLEQKEDFSWHAGMQLEFATIQNSNLKDLVSLVNPTSEFSFNNFLYENGRLEMHHIANFSAILRWEYEQYMQWVIKKIKTVKLGCDVKLISPSDNGFKILFDNKGKEETVITENISVGVGVKPFIPNCITNKLSDKVFHNSQ